MGPVERRIVPDMSKVMSPTSPSVKPSSNIQDVFDSLTRDVVQFLESHPGVTRVQFFEREAASSDSLRKWEMDNMPFELPADLKAFLAISNGLQVRWQIKMREETIPLGNMRVNSLHAIQKVPVEPTVPGEEPFSRRKCFWLPSEPEAISLDDVVLAPRCTTNSPTASPVAAKSSSSYSLDSPHSAGGFNAFDLDADCEDGRVVLFYRTSVRNPEVWFQDMSGDWFFIANSFTDFFRLMVIHLGLPRWMYSYTKVGLDPVAEQWIRFLSPERLAIDKEHRAGFWSADRGAADRLPSMRRSKSGERSMKTLPIQKLDLAKVHEAVKKGSKELPKSSHRKADGKERTKSIERSSSNSGRVRTTHSARSSSTSSASRKPPPRPQSAFTRF